MKSDINGAYAVTVNQQLDAFSRSLKIHRNAAGWTRAYVGEKVGVTPECIGHIERGDRRPHLPTALAIMELFRHELSIPYSALIPEGDGSCPSSRQPDEISLQRHIACALSRLQH